MSLLWRDRILCGLRRCRVGFGDSVRRAVDIPGLVSAPKATGGESQTTSRPQDLKPAPPLPLSGIGVAVTGRESRRSTLVTLLARSSEIALAGVAGGVAAMYVNHRQRDTAFVAMLKIHKERFRSGLSSYPMVEQLREFLIASEDLLDGHPEVLRFYEKWFKDGESPFGRTGTTMTGDEPLNRYRAFLRDLQSLDL